MSKKLIPLAIVLSFVCVAFATIYEVDYQPLWFNGATDTLLDSAGVLGSSSKDTSDAFNLWRGKEIEYIRLLGKSAGFDAADDDSCYIFVYGVDPTLVDTVLLDTLVEGVYADGFDDSSVVSIFIEDTTLHYYWANEFDSTDYDADSITTNYHNWEKKGQGWVEQYHYLLFVPYWVGTKGDDTLYLWLQVKYKWIDNELGCLDDPEASDDLDIIMASTGLIFDRERFSWRST